MKILYTALKPLLVAILATVASLHFAYSQNVEDRQTVDFGLTYTGDFVNGLSGGIKSGTCYLGYLSASAKISSEGLRLWKNGSFTVNFANTHGATPSESRIGDYQGASNIEAGNRTFFMELYYKHELKSLQLSAGILDMNSAFCVNSFGATFINSSFGLHSTFSDNVTASVFPNTGLGAVVAYELKSKSFFKVGFFDGNPNFLTLHPAVYSSPFEGSDGFMTIGELSYEAGAFAGEAGSYRIGAYYHSHNESIAVDDNSIGESTYGFYFVGNQTLGAYSEAGNPIDAFLQLSYSPVNTHTNQLYVGAGCILRDVAFQKDELGLAFGYAKLKNHYYDSEKVVELTYKCWLHSCIYLQPDLQLVLNPSRFNVSTPNALVAMLRFGVEL